ncbi:uncharacterized protein LOC126191262 [Schistocerca cancellata]|uniref:uncharacterized protein LOC126191262 n=1 Tax=Schistocerca cancellata TaxID=274614 RepID=UPI00211872A2|nr:uncharacterized protein LOC126191262 [Schistocerca cancellata]
MDGKYTPGNGKKNTLTPVASLSPKRGRQFAPGTRLPGGDRWRDVTAAVCLMSCLGSVVGMCGARTVAQAIADQQDDLFELVLRFFAKKVTVPAALARLLRLLKRELGASRGMIFLLDDEDPSKAHLFREPLQPGPDLIKRDTKVSLPEEAGAVLEAAQRVEPVVLGPNQLRDSRQLSRHLLLRGRIRAGALCLPLSAQPGHNAFAVVLLGDKLVSRSEKSERGAELDSEGFKAEAARRWLEQSGCAALLSLVGGLARRELGAARPLRPKSQVLRGTLSHALRPHPATLRAHAHTRPLPQAFREFGWAPPPLEDFQHVDGVHLVLAAAEDLLGGEDEIGERSVWIELVYTVAMCYRDVPYHNFRLALSILQCVYAILRRNEVFFTDVELQAMFLAALCVHLDHRGLTEQFLRDSDHPLSHIYPPPIVHNHHFEVLKIIVEPLAVFPHTDRQQLLAEVRCLLLSTELTAYFRTRRRLLRLLKSNDFFWNQPPHRRLVKDALMAAAVHSALCRNYPDNSRAADLLAEEWFQQGDLERELGLTPLAVMDREQADSRGGVSAQDALALLLTLALTNTRPMLRLALATARYWRGVSEGRRRRSTDTGRTSVERERARRSTAAGAAACSTSGCVSSRDPHSPVRIRDAFW